MRCRHVLKLFLFNYLLAVAAGCAHGGRQPASEGEFGRPVIIGHRGASGLMPEHTRGSFELAIAQGADYIEPDLVVTKDKVLIVRHENELSATTDVAKKFPKRKKTKIIDGKRTMGWFAEDFTWSEIKTLRAKERLPERDHSHDFQYPILSFADVLDIAKKANRPVGVCPEMKHPGYFKRLGKALEPLLVKELEKVGWNSPEAPVMVQSAEQSSLKALSKISQVKLIWLADAPADRPVDLIGTKDKRTYVDLLKPEALRTYSGWLYGIGPWKRLIVPEGQGGQLQPPTSLVSDAHAVGLKVFPYTFRSEKTFLAKDYEGDPQREYRQFFFLGVDGVFSDFPGDAVKAASPGQASTK